MYKVPSNIDLNKIFLVERKDIVGRLDSFFYKDEFQKLNEVLNNCKYKTVYFKDIIKSINNGYDFRDYKTEGVPYIKVANVKKGEFDFSKIQYIQFGSEDISKNIQLKKGNILLTRKGTYGNALSLDKNYDYVISSEVFYIELKQELVNSKYLEIFFNSKSGQKQFTRYSIGAIMGSLSQDVLKILRIPLPDIHIQNQIVKIYESAFERKKSKILNANNILDKIDEFLLESLGIILPVKDYSLKNRIFETNLHELTGSRFDALSNKNKDLEVALFNGKYSTVKLSKLVNKVKTGSTPHNSLNPYSNEGIPFLRNTNLKKGELSFKGIKYIKEEFSKFLTYSYYDEVIVCIAGTVGESVLNNSTTPLAINQNITALEINKDLIHPNFLNFFLNTDLSYELVKRLCSIATIYYLNNSNLLNLNIPVPPLDIQNKIVNEIEKMRTQVNRLKEEAEYEIENALLEIENIIFS